MVTDQNKYACRVYLASQTNFNKRKWCSKGHKFNCQHLKIGDFTWIAQTYRSLSGDKVELSSDVRLTQGMSSPVPLPFSLVSMGLRSSQWLFIKVFCAALLFPVFNMQTKYVKKGNYSTIKQTHSLLHQFVLYGWFLYAFYIVDL